ncbi:phage minor capsid protein [Treponema denticola]|uniref:phage minor capsid protein n=1 Tax=Treponema denticola TaxID=158 RepID=UPI0011C910CB|nr:phage minor capsid protein [Treponema denticola]
MLSPRYLEGLSDDIIEIYSQLETEILQDMARRIARLGSITEATRWQAQMLAEAGGLKKNIARILAKYDKAIIRQVTETFTEALETNARNDNRIFKAMTGRTVSTPNAQAMLSTIQKCHSDLSRLTLTTAATSQQQFVQQANRVYMDVQSGAFDYNTAMKSAADELSKRGITTVRYENGKPIIRSIESAVRMNILTSINQTAANQTLSNAEELGVERFEVTAHIGARPDHAAWQGCIFTRKELYSVCELGTATGLCGINCRHSFYPYFEGMEEHYTGEDLDEMASKTVTYNGEELSRYEGEQKLRGVERKIRQYKRQALTQEAAGADSTQARRKLGEWQAAARDFTKQTGIRRDRAREYVGTPTGKQPKGITPVTGALQKQEKIKIVYAKMQQKEYDEAVANCQKNLTEKQIKQIWSHNYSKGGYVSTANGRNINRILRKIGIESLNADDKETVKILREAISKNTLKKDTILIRNVQPDWIEGVFGIKGKNHLFDFETDIKPNADVKKQIESILKGKTITESQFLSCSVNEDKNFFNSFGVRLEIHAPKGTNCYFPDNKEESECILDIGQKLNILDVTITDKRVNVVCEIITGGKK